MTLELVVLRRALLCAATSCMFMLYAGMAEAQVPVNAGIQPSPASAAEAAMHRATALAAVGTHWQNTYEVFCGNAARGGNSPDDPDIKPQKIFDNVFVIGDRGTAIYVLKTNAGVMLIDSGYAQKTEPVLLAGLKELGIDPATVKYILITHGHPDHFGGSTYFQEHFGTRVVASEADWQLMANPRLPPSPPQWLLAAAPKHDLEVAEGGEIVLGDMHVRAYLVPGHTPGALGFVFPVRDNGKQRMAAIFGGTILGAARTTSDVLKQYVQSLSHFAQVTAASKVEVELQNHPMFDDMWIKAEQLSNRAAKAPNPFVVGADGYQGFMTVMSECFQAILAERQ